MPDAIAVPTELIPDIWPAVRDYIAEAMTYYPFMDEGDVLDQVLRGQAQLIVVVAGPDIPMCAVMEARTLPRFKVAWVLALGGRVGSLAEHVDRIGVAMEDWSRAQGCSNIACIGRRGWTRAWKRRGWKILPSVTATKEL
jgi:hypothetical protein